MPYGGEVLGEFRADQANLSATQHVAASARLGRLAVEEE